MEPPQQGLPLAQEKGWPAIAAGDHTLILAPTGSGKTLTAFLWGIDRLMTEPVPERERRTRLLYISPLRALDGVVDNGASVVALVQAAQALSAYSAKHRIIIIFFDQEELGLLGSKAWLAQADKSRIDAAVIFDVNAYGDSVIFGGLKSDRQGQVRASMNAVCARRLLDCMRFDTFPPSDDRSFADAGIPVVSVGQQPAADAHQMWLLMHKGPQAGLAQGVVPRVFTLIHTPADVMAAVEPAAVNRAFEMAFDLIQDLDDRYAAAPR